MDWKNKYPNSWQKIQEPTQLFIKLLFKKEKTGKTFIICGFIFHNDFYFHHCDPVTNVHIYNNPFCHTLLLLPTLARAWGWEAE